MAEKDPHFFGSLQKHDPEFYEAAIALRRASRRTPLDEKTVVLICLALDAANGSTKGVQNLSRTAREMGITEDEIKGALRLVVSNQMNHAISTTVHAFGE